MKSGEQRRKLTTTKTRDGSIVTIASLVIYRDGEKFVRVYADRVKATKFAERQKKSPVVKEARITQVGK